MSLFVFFISLLIVAQHVSGNHVPIIRSWRLRDVIALCWYVPIHGRTTYQPDLTTFLQSRHIPTQGYNITQSSAPDDGHMVARNMLSNYWKRNKEYKKWHLVGFSYPHCRHVLLFNVCYICQGKCSRYFCFKSLHSATLFTSLEFLFEVSDKKTNTSQNESVGLCHVGYSQIGTYATFPHTWRVIYK